MISKFAVREVVCTCGRLSGDARDELLLVPLLVVNQLTGQELDLVLVVHHDVAVEEHWSVGCVKHLPAQEHLSLVWGDHTLAGHKHLNHGIRLPAV